MSTYYCMHTREPVRMAELFGGVLEKYGIQEHVNERTEPGSRCLCDGSNYLWVNAGDDGLVGQLARYGMNDAGRILAAIQEVFGAKIFSEHEPQYWGCSTMEEWLDWRLLETPEEQEEFYIELMRNLDSEPNYLLLDFIVARKMRLARALLKSEPALADPQNKSALLRRVRESYIKEAVKDLPSGAPDLTPV